MDTPGDGVWTLKQVRPGSVLQGQRIDLRSPQISEEPNARLVGERARAALMAVALQGGYGLIMSERLPGGRIFEAGRRLLAGDQYDALLDDVLGITIYADSGRTGFVGVPPAQLVTTSVAQRMLDKFAATISQAVAAEEATVTAFDLWASSRSEHSSRARLLLLVMAVEALAEQSPRPEEERRMLDGFIEAVRRSALNEDAQERLSNGLSLLKRHSVGVSCRAMIDGRLAGC